MTVSLANFNRKQGRRMVLSPMLIKIMIELKIITKP